MRIFTEQAIKEYAEAHPDAKVALQEWSTIVKKSEWTCFADVKKTFNSVDNVCYNTFPFPSISETQKKELERLAQEVLDVRDQHFDMTPGEMYNPESMPEDLKEVHHRLDLAVDRCYRSEPFSSDEERLECLFMLYAKMTKK